MVIGSNVLIVGLFLIFLLGQLWNALLCKDGYRLPFHRQRPNAGVILEQRSTISLQVIDSEEVSG